MNIKKNIPNAITCGNLLCGCLAIVFAFKGNLVWSAYLVGIAAVLDFLDGFVARLLKVHSEIGKQLDSLADMVTFGVVPGVIVFHLFKLSILPTSFHDKITVFEGYLPYLAFIITIFSALRLAKFNIDTRQSDSFIGVPTPANTILIASLPLILSSGTISHGYTIVLDDVNISGSSFDEGWTIYPPVFDMNEIAFYESILPQYSTSFFSPVILTKWFLLSITLLMSWLLVAELPLFALKFKHFKWKGNEIRYIFLGLSAALLILFQFTAIPFIIFLYILLSVINNIGKKKKEKDYDLIAKQ